MIAVGRHSRTAEISESGSLDLDAVIAIRGSGLLIRPSFAAFQAWLASRPVAGRRARPR
jgi:hypothetical protein